MLANIRTASGTVYVIHDDLTISRISDDIIHVGQINARPFTLEAPIVVGERFRYRLTDSNECIDATIVTRMVDGAEQPVDRLDWLDLGLSDPTVLRNLNRHLPGRDISGRPTGRGARLIVPAR